VRDLAQINDWYEHLVEDCKAIITESVFASRWALVQGYWEIGQRIREDDNFKKYAKGNESSLTDLSKNIGIGQRDLYRSLQLYDKYPNIDEIPEGKNISWNKLITKYLPQETEDKPVENFITCPTCAGKGKVKYEIPQN
jgi:hypothetical protein